MDIKKRVALYLTDEMHKELKKQADSYGLDMGAYVVHLLMKEKEKSKNEAMVKELLQVAQLAINNPGLLEMIKKGEMG